MLIRMNRKFAWFSHSLDGPNRKIGIYVAGSLITMKDVAELDETDSTAFLESERKLSRLDPTAYLDSMQQLLHAYYAKAMRPIQLPASF